MIGDMNEAIKRVGLQVYSEFNNNLRNIQCNNRHVITLTDQFILVHRLCNENGIDWMFVLSVPQWNYISNMVLAIIAAVVSACIIGLVSTVTAVVFSLRIVNPFHQLIQSFELVSNMQLDHLNLKKSRLTEVTQLQLHFTEMVKRIKLYRAFIPSHLLAQLESDDGNGEVAPNTNAESQELSRKSSSSMAHSSKRLSSQKTHLDRFSLYSEKRMVSAVMLHLDGLNEWWSGMSGTEIVSLLSDVFEAINQQTRSMSAQMGAFDSDSQFIFFNAANELKKHQEKALTFCDSLRSKLLQIKTQKWVSTHSNSRPLGLNSQLLTPLSFRMAVTCQECICGNLGTREFKSFQVVGSIQSNLESMMQVANTLNIPIIISHQIEKHCNEKYQMRFVQYQDLFVENYYSRHVSKSRGVVNASESTLTHSQDSAFSYLTEQCQLFEVGENNTSEMDEWMYELESKEKKNQRWLYYNLAIKKYFVENQVEQACEMMHVHMGLETSKYDLVAQNMFALIQNNELGVMYQRKDNPSR